MKYKVVADKKKARIKKQILIVSGLVVCVTGIFILWQIIILGVFLIAMTPFVFDVEMYAYNDRFEIKYISYLKLVSGTDVFHFDNLYRITYRVPNKKYDRVLLTYTSITHKAPNDRYSLEIVDNDGFWRAFYEIGEYYEFKQLSMTIIESFKKYKKEKGQEFK